MPALVIAAPIQIDLTYFSRQFSTQINPMGIFAVGSDVYLVLVYTYNLPVNQVPIAIYRSTDKGLTWVEQDSANHPTLPQTNDRPGSVFFDSSSGIIYILWRSQDGSFEDLVVSTFSTGTNLYTGTSSNSAVAKEAFFPAIYRQSGGTVVVVTQEGNPTQSLKYFTLSGGIWAGPTALGTVSSPFVYGVVVDSSDRGQLFYSDAAGNLKHALISAGLTLGTPTTLASTPPWDENDIDQRIWNNKIVMAWTETNVLKVAIGTPLSAPVFTTYTVDTVGGSGNLTYPTLAQDKDGNLVVFVAYTDYSGSPIIDELSMWTFDGVSSWGSPVLFYDEVANPPSNSRPQINQFIHTGAAYQFPSGAWVYSTALETTPPNNCTGFALVSPAVSPPSVTLEDDLLESSPALNVGGGSINPHPTPGPVTNPTECIEQE